MLTFTLTVEDAKTFIGTTGCDKPLVIRLELYLHVINSYFQDLRLVDSSSIQYEKGRKSAAKIHVFACPAIKERSSIKATSGGTTKEFLSNKPSGFTLNLNSEPSVNDDCG